MKLILGSGSAQRKQILSFYSVEFEPVTSHFPEESVTFHGDPALFATEVSVGKAKALQERFSDHPILTADTVVYKEGRLYQKPATVDEAEQMIRELSQGEQQVFTGVSLLYKGTLWSAVEESRVEFCELTPKQIRAYVETLKPFDKSGSYTVQGMGGLIVKRVSGCYYNIVGLPVQTVRRLLLHVGIDLWDSFNLR